MGKFVLKEKEGYKQYTVFSKKGFKNLLALENVFPQYTFSFEEKVLTKETYYDSKANNLDSAGIVICKVDENSKGYIRIEREFMQQKGIVEKNKEEKVYIHQILPKDTLADHMFYIIDGISNLFSTQFHIDLENVIKTAIPKINIINKLRKYKIYGGTGFKAEMYFETIIFKNFESKRSAKTLMLVVKNLSSEKFMPSFNDFLFQIEKHVKELINSPESKYDIARKMTRPITQADIDKAKAKKEKNKKDKNEF